MSEPTYDPNSLATIMRYILDKGYCDHPTLVELRQKVLRVHNSQSKKGNVGVNFVGLAVLKRIENGYKPETVLKLQNKTLLMEARRLQADGDTG